MKVYADCTEVREDFSALLDGELSVEEQDAVEAHLSECSSCLRELDGLKRVDTLFGSMPDVPAPAGFESAVRDSLNPKRGLLWPRSRGARRGLGLLAAAAAGILVMVGVLLPRVQDEDRYRTAKVEQEPVGGRTNGSPAYRRQLEGVAPMSDAISDEGTFERGLATDAASLEPTLQNNRPLGAAIPVDGEEDEAFGFESQADLLEQAQRQDAPDAKDSVSSVAPAVPAEVNGFLRSEAAASPERLARSPKPAQELKLEESEALTNATGALSDGNDSAAVSAESAPDARELVVRQKAAGNAGDASSVDFDQFGVASGAAQDASLELKRQRSFGISGANESLDKSDATGDAIVRRFDVRDGVWYERGYNGEPTVKLARASEKWRELRGKYPELQQLDGVPQEIVFRADTVWCALEKLPEAP